MWKAGSVLTTAEAEPLHSPTAHSTVRSTLNGHVKPTTGQRDITQASKINALHINILFYAKKHFKLLIAAIWFK